jgi:hypothetical protein
MYSVNTAIYWVDLIPLQTAYMVPSAKNTTVWMLFVQYSD